MLLFFGLFLLLKSLAAEVCSANQQSTVTLTVTNGTTINRLGYLPVNVVCYWIMTGPVGEVLRIQIIVYSPNNKKSPCYGSLVKIYDGNSTGSDVRAEHNCRSNVLSLTYFISSGRTVLLEVKTGSVVNSTAIRLKYQALPKEEPCSTNSTLDAPLSPVVSTFSSPRPYYPLSYSNTPCGWYITAPDDHVVMLKLWIPKKGFYMDSEITDTVEVFDVDGSELIPMALPGWKLYSKFQAVYVVFKSNHWLRRKRIFVQYSAVRKVSTCSSGNSIDENMNIFLEDSSGTIKTPGYPSGYLPSLLSKCFWKIIVPTGKVLRIEFLSFRLGQHDNTVITDKINGLSPLSIWRSGTQPSFKFYSTGHELSIKVDARVGNSGPGFIADYRAVPTVMLGACVLEKNSIVHMVGEGISFSSPGYPSYSGQGTCRWNITGNPGEFIKVTFWSINGTCEQNYIKVFDVINSTSVSLGKFCNIFNDKVYSRSNTLMVNYTSLHSGVFFATYESIKAIPAKYSCQITRDDRESRRVEMKDFNGEFASYNYPLPYSNDAECLWKIERPFGHVIQLTFHDFDLQQSEDCKADYVKIEQGSDWTRTPIGTLCGSSLPGIIQVNDADMYIDFVSDSSGKYSGFHASYQIRRDPAMGPCKYPHNMIRLTGETGNLSSPLYPRKFNDKINCTWVITAPEGNFVKLRIKTFDFTRCSRCSLTIRDGPSSSSVWLKALSQINYGSSVFSSSRHLWVQFISTQSYQGASFYAEFEVVKQLPASFACTASNKIVTLKSDTGTLASYNYPLPYDDPVECVWSISVDSDYNIKLSFDSFNLSQSSDCSEDYVEVHDVDQKNLHR